MAVKLKIHWLAGAPYGELDIPDLKTDLARLFATSGVQLDAEAGVQLSSGLSSRNDFIAAIDAIGDFPDQPPAAGHLILGIKGHPAEFPDALGALIDTDTRGIAAVFGNVHPLAAPLSASLLLQVCAHEVGHMFDLGHGECVLPPPTAMCQTKKRDAPQLAKAWQDLQLTRPAGLQAFPFSPVSDTKLRDGQPLRRPWGGAFTQGDLVEAGGLDIAIEPNRDRGVTGEAFGFDVVVTNRGTRRRRIPRLASAELGTLNLRITRPDGVNYLHRPAVKACGGEEELLAPGSRRFHPHAIYRGPGSQVFPFPGRYRFEAALGLDFSRSEPLEIDVVSRRKGTPGREFARFVSGSSPGRRWRQAKVLNGELRTGNCSRDPFVAHLAIAKARRSPALFVAEPLLDAVARSAAAPRALRHAAWLDRCWRVRESPQRLQDLLAEAGELFDDDSRDRNFHDQIVSLGAAYTSRGER